MWSVSDASARPLIWIVDDSRTQAAFTERSLGERYRYETFADGTSVIERLAEATVFPDLVLLDWVMPGLSGDEVCRHLRLQPRTRELPIVILTASRTETDDIVCALGSGANDYVTKPFVPEELHARVGTILRAAEMQRLADREHQRVIAINAFAASMLEADTVERALEAMTRWLVAYLVDGCAVQLVHDATIRRHSEHRSEEVGERLRALEIEGNEPIGDLELVRLLAIRGLATARICLVRDPLRGPLDLRDVRMVQTCLEYSALAIEAALRSERDRKTTRFHEEMVGIVGHDLRGPLSALGLGLDMLLDDETGEHKRSTLARLQRSNVRMGRIVEQLLDVTRARIGTGIPVVPKRVELRALVEGVLDELRLARPQATLQFRGENEVEGNWDPDRIEQVVANLAGNALQHGRDGAVITFELSSTPGAAHLEVHNENRGDAIPAETQRTMFDPFERGRSATSDERLGTDVEGLGLGLYIVQQIVHAHRGTISVTSSESGTVFRITLPLGP